MVKANAYGHGMVGVSRVLEHVGVDVLGVAFVDEAITLRQHGIHMPIVVLTPFEEHEAPSAVAYNLEVVVADQPRVEALAAAAQRADKQVRCHVFVDTGMRRDGIDPEQAPAFAAAVAAKPGLILRGLCTHLASADAPFDEFNKEQLKRFDLVLEEILRMDVHVPDVHATNTGGIWNLPSSMYSMVRPGLSLYGYEPTSGRASELRPVMTLVSTVLSIRSVSKGETVSYGRRWKAASDTNIATVPIGYGDGYARSLSGVAEMLIQGQRVPVVGTVCMDECMLNIGGMKVSIGDEVVVMGYQNHGGMQGSIDAVELAAWLDTIPYEVTTAISARVPRVYKGAYAKVAGTISLEGSHV